MRISSINAGAFVSEVLNGAQVWGIRDKDGFPTSTNASGETAMPFWSSENRAMSIIKSVPAYCDFTRSRSRYRRSSNGGYPACKRMASIEVLIGPAHAQQDMIYLRLI